MIMKSIVSAQQKKLSGLFNKYLYTKQVDGNWATEVKYRIYTLRNTTPPKQKREIRDLIQRTTKCLANYYNNYLTSEHSKTS